MKRLLATWIALIAVMVGILTWTIVNSHYAGHGHHFDPFPWILLNLCLSCFAALQCFVLLIANKRGEQIAAELALHTYETSQTVLALLQQNTVLTTKVESLTRAIHDHILGDGPKSVDSVAT